MGENQSPDDADLNWPVARGELDDLPTLKLGHDEAGRLAWQNMTPPGPDSYRAWLPKREKAAPLDDAADLFGDDPIVSQFASEATSTAAPEPVHAVEAPANAALEGDVEPTLTHAAKPDLEPAQTRAPAPAAEAFAEVPAKSRHGSQQVTAATSTPTPAWSTAVAAPLRLSLAGAPIDTLRPVQVSSPPPVPHARARIQQVTLLGTGAVIGAMAAAMAVGVAWRLRDQPVPATAAGPALVATGAPSAPALIATQPLPLGVVRLARPVAPHARLTLSIVPAARPAAADIAPVRTAPPVRVAAVAAPSGSAVAPAPPRARAAGVVQTEAARAASSPPIVAPPAAMAMVGRFAAAYNRMDAGATQAVWPSADRQALVTTFTALREQRLTLSGCRGTMQDDTATVMCRGALRYRPRVGNHDTRTVEGTWRFTMLRRTDDWVVDNVESPNGQ